MQTPPYPLAISVRIATEEHRTTRTFLKALAKACPIRITRLLTENEPQAKFQRSYNGKAFTDRLFGARDYQASGEHEFDQLCQALGIEHRLTKPRALQTNGMVERFNGRISDILKDPSLLLRRRLEGDLASLRGLVQSSTAASRAGR